MVKYKYDDTKVKKILMDKETEADPFVAEFKKFQQNKFK